MKERDGWDIETFFREFEAHHTPELLVVILIEALSELERHYRRGATAATCELKPSAIRVDCAGGVSIANGTLVDLRALTALFQKFLPDNSRVHPELQRLFAKLQNSSIGARSWRFRAYFLDYLYELGLDGAQFLLSRFLQDPVAYNRAATSAIAARECERIRRLNRWGLRGRVSAELGFLLEIAPVNRQALELWREVRQGGIHTFAKALYVLVVIGVVIATGTVIAEKLHLPPLKQGPRQLFIQPVDPPGNANAAEAAALEENSRDTPAKPGARHGTVELDFEHSAQVYFDGGPGAVPGHGSHETVRLSEGRHDITVVRPGQPPVMAQITVQVNRVISLTDRSHTH